MFNYKNELIMDFKRAGLILRSCNKNYSVYQSQNGRVAIMPERIESKKAYRQAFKQARL